MSASKKSTTPATAAPKKPETQARSRLGNSTQWKGLRGLLSCMPPGVRDTLRRSPHVQALRLSMKETQAAQKAAMAKESVRK